MVKHPRCTGPSGAWFSEDGVHRYLLWRELQGALPLFPMDVDDHDRELQTWGTCLFIMLNPSTADATQDDPTVRRCIDYATRWGFSRLHVCNVFALRSTDPEALKQAADPIGPENDAALLMSAQLSDKIVCAWGNHATLKDRGWAVQNMLVGVGHKLWCLAQNQSGAPVHPLYQRKDLDLQPLSHRTGYVHSAIDEAQGNDTRK